MKPISDSEWRSLKPEVERLWDRSNELKGLINSTKHDPIARRELWKEKAEVGRQVTDLFPLAIAPRYGFS